MGPVAQSELLFAKYSAAQSRESRNLLQFGCKFSNVRDLNFASKVFAARSSDCAIDPSPVNFFQGRGLGEMFRLRDRP